MPGSLPLDSSLETGGMRGCLRISAPLRRRGRGGRERAFFSEFRRWILDERVSREDRQQG